MSDGRCIHCGQKGHYSMMCPKKPNSACESHYKTTHRRKSISKTDSVLSLKKMKGRRFTIGKPSHLLTATLTHPTYD